MAGMNDHGTGDRYKIQVQGHLDQRWSDWFGGFEITYHGGNTILAGTVADQAALHGALAKIRDLGLAIFLVERLDCKGEYDETSFGTTRQLGFAVHSRRMRRELQAPCEAAEDEG